MDQGAPPAGPLTPAPTREVLGDLLFLMAKAHALHDQLISMLLEQQGAFEALVVGNSDTAFTEAQQARAKLMGIRSQHIELWDELFPLMQRFAGQARD